MGRRVINGLLTVWSVFTGKQSLQLRRTALRFASGCTFLCVCSRTPSSFEISLLLQWRQVGLCWHPVQHLHHFSPMLQHAVLIARTMSRKSRECLLAISGYSSSKALKYIVLNAITASSWHSIVRRIFEPDKTCDAVFSPNHFDFIHAKSKPDDSMKTNTPS